MSRDRSLRFAVLICVRPILAEAQAEGSASFSIAGTTHEDVAAFLGKLQQAVPSSDSA